MSEVRLVEANSGPILENYWLRITIHLKKGTFDLAPIASGGPTVSDAATSVTLAGQHFFTSRGNEFEFEGAAPVEDVHGRGLALYLRREADEGEPDLTVTLSLYEDQPFAVISSELHNTTRAPMHVASFDALEGGHIDLGSPAQAWRFYKHGWQSWSPTLVLPCSGEDIAMRPPVIAPGSQPEARDGRFVSEMMTAIVDTAEAIGLIAGFISTANQFSHVLLDREPRSLTAISYADGLEVPPGGRLASERLLLEPTGEPIGSLQRYGAALGREMQALPSEKVASGWCSWYYYWQGVREEQIVANLEQLAGKRQALPVDYVQIDDGYQSDIGDWLTVNDKFPHGLRWLVDQIHTKGIKAGLWLAPFLIGANSQLYKEHPDWTVQYRPGKPCLVMQNWGQDCYALDLTRPEVIDWIEGIFSTICEEWGFDYVKIDFIYAGAVDGLRSDPNITRAQAYRRGLEAIRRAVGDRFILGCGNPLGPSVGLVDGSRIGPDVGPYWEPAIYADRPERNHMSEPSCLNSIRNSITRFWMQGALWMNDPDCLLVRDSETALTQDEVRTLATVIAMSGGMVLDSDDLSRLPEERRQIISMLLPVYGKAAIPLDLFESETPRLLELDCGTHRMVAVFNWDDNSSETRAPLQQQSHVFDVWAQEHLGMHAGAVALSIAPRGCRLLRITPVQDRPAVIGTAFHLLQGTCEIESEEWDGAVLRLALNPVAAPKGRLFIAAPASFGRPIAPGVEVKKVAKGVYSVGVIIAEPTEVVLEFPPAKEPTRG